MIKKLITIHLCLLSAMLVSHADLKQAGENNPYDLQNGDIVFQGANDPQAKAVKAATNSQWSHVGIIFLHQGKPWVLEAVQPVKTTVIDDFIARNPKSFYAMRLKNARLHINSTSIKKAEKYAKLQIGKDYDPYFQWSDKKIYCSELVWKIYQHATGIKLCTPRLLSSYHLHHPSVQAMIKQRYGSMSKLPMNELMVAPSDIARSNFLIEAPRKIQKMTKK